MDGGSALTQKTDTFPKPPRAPLEAVQIVEVLARAVHYAHQRGVVHRDLKPSNALLTSDGLPKIADFGVAEYLHSLEDQGKPVTIMGTPSYMAPEQIHGKVEDIGPRTDVYGLGAIFYELLTGCPPFRAETMLGIIAQVMTKMPDRLKVLNPNLDPDLEAICLKCLEKMPQNRYPSAEGLAEDLRRFLARSFWRCAWRWRVPTCKSAQLSNSAINRQRC